MRGRIVELEQGTDEWLAWRREGITATAAGQIAKLYPRDWNRTPADLEARMIGLATEWHNAAATERMERGHEGEARVRAAFEASRGRAYPPACVEHHRLPQIRASLDGLNVEHDEIAEFKWPTHRGLLDKVRAGQIPAYYYCQVQHQLLAAGVRTAWFVVGYDDNAAPCLDPTERCQRFGCLNACGVAFESLLIKPNRHFLDGLLRAELAFWDRVVGRPARTARYRGSRHADGAARRSRMGDGLYGWPVVPGCLPLVPPRLVCLSPLASGQSDRTI